MKSVVFLISILLVSYVLNKGCNLAEGSKVDDCKNLDTIVEDSHCCLLESSAGGQSAKICTEVLKKDYDNIKDYVKKLEDQVNNAVDYDIDCGCSYLSISLLGLLLFLI